MAQVEISGVVERINFQPGTSTELYVRVNGTSYVMSPVALTYRTLALTKEGDQVTLRCKETNNGYGLFLYQVVNETLNEADGTPA